MKPDKALISFLAYSCVYLFTFLATSESKADQDAIDETWPIHSPHLRRHHKKHRTTRSPTPSSPVRTKTGDVEGLTIDVNGKKINAFYGVPFAEPPIGEFRFKSPNPRKPWDGVFKANTPSKSCFQGSDSTYSTRGADMWNAKTEKTEDCLCMNIWAPIDAQNATVMVWLFGGGFWYGSASLDIYNGLGLAAEGRVIVVTPNYRLGVFGFLYLDHADVPGNMGLLDQRLALKWIQENIAAFGGDPNKVNLFGESAGAASIVAHMVSPESWPLFHNGILQSGTLDNPWAMDTPSKALNRSLGIVRSVGCNHSNTKDMLECVRNKPAKDLDDAMWTLDFKYLEFPLVIVSRDRAGFFQQDAYESLRQGRYRPNTDLMFGINQDEGTFWMAYYELQKYFHPFNDTLGGKEKLINNTRFNECVEDVILKSKPQAFKSAVLWEYRNRDACSKSRDPAFYRNQLNQLIGDYYFTCDSLWLAEDVVKRNTGRVYVYHFEQRIGNNPWPQWMGVMHGYEIEYIFGLPLLHANHHKIFANGGQNHTKDYYNYASDDRQFSKDIIQYWTSFASTGIPKGKNHGRQNEWPPYTLENKEWYILKAKTTITDKPLHKQKESECKMWRSIRDIEYERYQEKYLSPNLHYDKYLSGSISLSFPIRTLLIIATTQSILLNLIRNS